MTLYDVLGFGVISVDDLLYVDHYLPPDGKAQVRERRRDGGGLTGTALVAAARLGARAAYCGILGDDEASRWAQQSLEREGIDCSRVLHRPEARPTQSVIIVEQTTGRRTIYYSRAGVTPRRPQDMGEELIASTRVLFVDHTVAEAALAAAELAHRHGIPIVADIEQEHDPFVPELLPQIDHLIVSIELARRATGEAEPEAMVRGLGGPGRAACVVTAGERGAWYAERGGAVHHVPALAVQTVDTTGCGDVFHGAYAACIARGETVERAVLVATATAGLKATHPGGRAGIPYRATVEALLAS